MPEEEFDYIGVRAWMDKLVDMVRDYKTLKYYNNQISTCNSFDSVQIYKGIDILADVMDLPLNESETQDKEYPYNYSVFYHGVRFYQISKRRRCQNNEV